jgi:hypothetical protein
MDAKQIIKRYEIAYGKKGTVDTRYREVFEYVMPDRDGYDQDGATDKGFTYKRGNIFSSVGINAANTFVNRLQGLLTPIKADFLELKVGVTEENKTELDKSLEEVAQVINVLKNKSNFDQEMGSFYYDLVAGTACLLVQKGDVDRKVIFRAIPIKDICVMEGVGGEVSDVYRKMMIRRGLLPYQWTELKKMEVSKDKEDEEAEIIECTHYDYDKKVWVYYVVDRTADKILVERESEVNPFIVLRWGSAPGEIYGRGVGLQALPDIKTHNEMRENMLISAAFNLPTFLAEMDGILDPDEFQLKPGVINPVASTASNNPSVVPLQVNTQMDIAKFNMTEVETSIKKTMLDNVLPDDIRPGITATEIVERTQASNINISSVFGRLENDLLFPLALNLIHIAKQFGDIAADFDLNLLKAGKVEVIVNTPLMKQQQQQQVQSSVAALGILAQFDPEGGVIMAAIKMPGYVNWLLDKMGFPSEFNNSPEEMEQALVAQAQAQAQAAQAEQVAEVEGKMAVDTNKAEANAGN